MKTIHECLLEVTGKKAMFTTDRITVLQAFNLAEKYAEQFKLNIPAVSEALPCTCVGEFGSDESCKACYPIERL